MISGADALEHLVSGRRQAVCILAIDYGLRRMGLAVSDLLGITAQGLETLEHSTRDDDLKKLTRLVAEYEVSRVIVGNPIHLDGGVTAMSEKAARFAEQLRRRLSCPVDLWDERLSTAQAEASLREMDAKRSTRRKSIDRMAATLLLQSYLDCHPVHTPQEENCSPGGTP